MGALVLPVDQPHSIAAESGALSPAFEPERLLMVVINAWRKCWALNALLGTNNGNLQLIGEVLDAARLQPVLFQKSNALTHPTIHPRGKDNGQKKHLKFYLRRFASANNQSIAQKGGRL